MEKERVKLSNGTLAGSASIVGAGTALSRIFGLIREQTFAHIFGAGMANDAFVAAFRVPNLLRDLFAEGAMSSAFVPVFTDVMEKGGREKARLLLCKVFVILIIILSIVCCIGVFVSPWLVHLLAFGFKSIPGKLELTTHLAQLMFPFLLFIGMAALAMGVLNSLKKFSIPAIAPVFLNIGMISAGFFLCPLFGKMPENQIYGMAFGVILGGFLQFFFQVPSVLKKFKFSLSDFNLRGLHDPDVKRIGLLLMPALLGLSATQINIFVSTQIASLLPEGSVSYLNYGNRIVQLPIGVFGVAVATVVLPMVSSYVAKGEKSEVIRSVSDALRLVFFLSIPSMISLIVISKPLVSLLYEHGRFSGEDTIGAANALSFYSIGLFAYCCVRSLVPVFYSLGESGTPVKISFFVVGLNITLSLVLMKPLGYNGLALATSISAVVNMMLLLFFLRRKLGRVDGRELLLTFLRIGTAACVMGGFLFVFLRFTKEYLISMHISSKLADGALVLAGILFGGGLFLFISFLIRIKELNMIKEIYTYRRVK